MMIDSARFASRYRRPIECVLSIGLAWTAQWVMRSPVPVDGLALFAAAALLFAHSMRGIEPLSVPQPLLVEPPETARPISRPLLTMAWLASIIGFALFVAEQNGFGWLLWLASIALFVPSLWTHNAAPSRSTRAQWLEWAMLFVVLFIAIVPRLCANDQIPAGLWLDEAREGIAARQMLADPTYRPVYIPYVERPAHHMYLVALAFAFLGDTVSTLRSVATAFSLLNMLAAFLLFRRWFGGDARGGLLAAALLATMRYDLTLSRILFDANSTLFFMFTSAFLLDRGLRNRHQSDFALAGLVIGLGLGFYLPMRIYALLVISGGIAVAAAAAWRARSLAAVMAFRAHTLMFITGLWLASAPIVAYAVAKPDVFFDRNNSASVFYERAEPDLAVAVASSIIRHLGMFNASGDANGRHNLPGAPMFDDATGVLFMLGGALVLARLRRAPNAIMLVVFAAMMQAGALATDWEAPHALRAIGMLPAALYACTYGLTAVIKLAREQMGVRPRLAATAVTVLLLVIGWSNLDTYFNRQAHDDAVWRAHSIAETWTANEMRRLAPTHTIVLTERYREAPTIRFLAPDITPARTWDGAQQPLATDAGWQPTAIFLDESLAETAHAFAVVYPLAQIKTLTPPHGGAPVMYEILLPAQSP
ncbi:MAG: glycosyltransferase family 39 protein [Chloroflexi bacterium]|nr:glycosyltransferase family 39 protein [Chloroflexota bacterium]